MVTVNMTGLPLRKGQGIEREHRAELRRRLRLEDVRGPQRDAFAEGFNVAAHMRRPLAVSAMRLEQVREKGAVPGEVLERDGRPQSVERGSVRGELLEVARNLARLGGPHFSPGTPNGRWKYFARAR